MVFSTPFLNCTMIPIGEDSVVESTEQFFARLSSDDQAVVIAPSAQIATVIISDTSGIYGLYIKNVSELFLSLSYN